MLNCGCCHVMLLMNVLSLLRIVYLVASFLFCICFCVSLLYLILLCSLILLDWNNSSCSSLYDMIAWSWAFIQTPLSVLLYDIKPSCHIAIFALMNFSLGFLDFVQLQTITIRKACSLRISYLSFVIGMQ